MKLVCISDTHCQHEGLVIPECDVLIHAGDWTKKGSAHQTINFLRWFESQRQAKNKIFISGNHDFLPANHPILFAELLLTHAPNCTYLEEEEVSLGGLKIYGSPITPKFYNWAFNRERGAQIQAHWDQIPADTDILITHCPVRGYGDILSERGSEPGAHAGCEDLLKTIDSRLTKLKLHISGHIHEGYGTYQRGSLTLINVSSLDDRYVLTNPPIVIDTERLKSI